MYGTTKKKYLKLRKEYIEEIEKIQYCPVNRDVMLKLHKFISYHPEIIL